MYIFRLFLGKNVIMQLYAGCILWMLYIMEAVLPPEASQGADKALHTLLFWQY